MTAKEETAEEYMEEKHREGEYKTEEHKATDTDDPAPILAIMRPESYREKSEALARAYGFEPFYAPMIRLEGLKDERFEPFVQRVIKGISDYVIFTSANGITFTLDKLSESEKESFTRAMKKIKVIAIGPNTEKELLKMGIENPFLPEDYSSEGIVRALCPEVKGKTVELARSRFGAGLLIEGLEGCGAKVYETHVYTLIIAEGKAQEELIERSLAGDITAFAFTSSMMVKGFMKHAELAEAGDSIKAALKAALVGAIGTPTAKTLEKYGVSTDAVPEEFTFEALLAALKSKLENASMEK